MFKRLLLIVLCLVAGSICYAQSSDQPADQPKPDQPQVTEQPTTDQPAEMATEQNKTFNGTISSIDHKKMEITIKDDTTKDKQKFTFSTSTAFTRDGATITHDELKKGQHVSLEVDSTNAVTKIDVTPKVEEPKKEEKKDQPQ